MTFFQSRSLRLSQWRKLQRRNGLWQVRVNALKAKRIPGLFSRLIWSYWSQTSMITLGLVSLSSPNITVSMQPFGSWLRVTCSHGCSVSNRMSLWFQFNKFHTLFDETCSKFGLEDPLVAMHDLDVLLWRLSCFRAPKEKFINIVLGVWSWIELIQISNRM